MSKKKNRYRSDVTLYRLEIEPIDSNSNGGDLSPEIVSLARKLSRLPQKQREIVEAYIEGLLSERRQ